MYDIAIIGAGITGGMLARTLAAYDLKICILEKENDVAMGATRANSGIVHAGYDAEEGTLKARLNVRGSEMMGRVAEELGVPYRNNGSLVIGFTEEDRNVIERLYKRGIRNGVQNLRIIDGEEARRLEPNLSEGVICALHAPSCAIVCPYELAIAAIGNAMDNGADLLLNFRVSGVVRKPADDEDNEGNPDAGYGEAVRPGCGDGAGNPEAACGEAVRPGCGDGAGNPGAVCGETAGLLCRGDGPGDREAIQHAHGIQYYYEITEAIPDAAQEGEPASSSPRRIRARYVINAAGIYADEVAEMAGDTSIAIRPRKGEYLLLDSDCGGLVSHTIFRTPSRKGKGILITPTVDGNLLLGPTSTDQEDKEDTAATAEGFARIMAQAAENLRTVPFRKVITSFSGLRSVGNTGDFILTSPGPGFINAAGIESPGLTAAPAIAEHIVEMLREQGLILRKKQNYQPCRKPAYAFRQASVEEKNEMIRKNPAYGRVVCRCETVTEGEILEAIRTNPCARDLDGIKRRTRAQMGRCQGGFCMPYIAELLAGELGIPFEEVTKSGRGSEIGVETA